MKINTEYELIDLTIETEKDIEIVQSYGVYEDKVETDFRLYLFGEELTSIDQLKQIIKDRL